ncbi:MAG: hypothetical protein U0W40_07855 [Acidimicrobiia bacterium]
MATNLDNTYPVSGWRAHPGRRFDGGGGSGRRGRHPEVAGKPAPATAELVWERFGHGGDGGRPAQHRRRHGRHPRLAFALVLSGVTAAVAPPGGEAIPDPAPPFVGADLGALVDPLVASLLHA